MAKPNESLRECIQHQCQLCSCHQTTVWQLCYCSVQWQKVQLLQNTNWVKTSVPSITNFLHNFHWKSHTRSLADSKSNVSTGDRVIVSNQFADEMTLLILTGKKLLGSSWYNHKAYKIWTCPKRTKISQRNQRKQHLISIRLVLGKRQ